MKKSQAAMEFLMTYGWAITIVVISIAGLTYFGVLDIESVSKYLPDRCILPPGLACIDYKIEYYEIFGVPQNRVEFFVKNGLGTEITNIDIYFDDPSNLLSLTQTGDEYFFFKEPITFDGNKFNLGEKYKLDFTLVVTADTGIVYSELGTIRGRVE